MNHVLALDLSTKTGWAVFENEELRSYGTLFPDKTVNDFGDYPFNFVLFSEYITDKVISLVGTVIEENKNLEVVVEETTSSKNNYSQKILEYIHHGVIKGLINFEGVKVHYIRVGVWRRIVGAVQGKEERSHNSKLARIKRKTGKRIGKIDGKVARKLNRKDYALRQFKKEFGIDLPMKMNDACDAALLGLSYIKGAPICDGTTKGGV